MVTIGGDTAESVPLECGVERLAVEPPELEGPPHPLKNRCWRNFSRAEKCVKIFMHEREMTTCSTGFVLVSFEVDFYGNRLI